MPWGLLRLAEEELGRTLARICAVAVVSGLVALLLAVAAGTPAAALSALAASWLFFSGLAAKISAASA